MGWSEFWHYWWSAARWAWGELGLLGGSGVVMSGVYAIGQAFVGHKAGHHGIKRVGQVTKTWLITMCIVLPSFFLFSALIVAPPNLQQSLMGGLQMYSEQNHDLQIRLDAQILPDLRGEIKGGVSFGRLSGKDFGDTLGLIVLSVTNLGAPSVISDVHIRVKVRGVTYKCRQELLPAEIPLRMPMGDGYTVAVPWSDNLLAQTLTKPILQNDTRIGWLMFRPSGTRLPQNPRGCQIEIDIIDARGRASPTVVYDIPEDAPLRQNLAYIPGLTYSSGSTTGPK